MTTDPIRRFQRWFKQAQDAKVPLAEAMALATADAHARPSVRFMLLKHADDQGFVFYTNARSRKGRDLHANPHASAAFYWDAIGKQVRIEGRIEELSAAEADDYWRTRPRLSQLAAVASQQSAAIASRDALVARWQTLRQQHARAVVPRPRAWLGFRIVPGTIEFWTRHAYRLHQRQLFTRTRNGWKHQVLQP